MGPRDTGLPLAWSMAFHLGMGIGRCAHDIQWLKASFALHIEAQRECIEDGNKGKGEKYRLLVKQRHQLIVFQLLDIYEEDASVSKCRNLLPDASTTHLCS